jgi:hypothetical protein
MKLILAISVVLLAFTGIYATAEPLTAEQKTKVDSQMKLLQPLGSDPVVVKAVREFNKKQPADTAGMTQARWDKLSVLDPIVKGLSRNALAAYLKTKRTPVMADLFVSGANGTKAALFSKTTNWSHKGKPKHDVPMTGIAWTGETEMDDSTGKVSVQISFPVLDAGKPIGSIVVSLDVSKL